MNERLAGGRWYPSQSPPDAIAGATSGIPRGRSQPIGGPRNRHPVSDRAHVGDRSEAQSDWSNRAAASRIPFRVWTAGDPSTHAPHLKKLARTTSLDGPLPVKSTSAGRNRFCKPKMQRGHGKPFGQAMMAVRIDYCQCGPFSRLQRRRMRHTIRSRVLRSRNSSRP